MVRVYSSSLSYYRVGKERDFLKYFFSLKCASFMHVHVQERERERLRLHWLRAYAAALPTSR